MIQFICAAEGTNQNEQFKAVTPLEEPSEMYDLNTSRPLKEPIELYDAKRLCLYSN